MNESRTTSASVLDRDGWNAVLAQLRTDGFSPAESIKITRTALHLPLGKAKQIVHDSGVWADLEEHVAAVHDALEAAAAEYGPTSG